MQIQLIHNATLRMTYGDHTFITDPYFAPKHSREPLIGKSRNPTADLPRPPENLLADVEMVLVSHLHPDHFDNITQQLLPKSIQTSSRWRLFIATHTSNGSRAPNDLKQVLRASRKRSSYSKQAKSKNED